MALRKESSELSVERAGIGALLSPGHGAEDGAAIGGMGGGMLGSLIPAYMINSNNQNRAKENLDIVSKQQ